MEPSTEVGAIPADIDGVSEKNGAEKCKHFSMRKYVSEMRQKDARKCWPFKLDYILSEVPKDVLPPLDVPKYRWWRCPHCLPEFWVTATDAENGSVPDASCEKSKLAGPFADAVRLSETATVASNFTLMLNLDMADVNESNPSISSEISPKRCNTSVLCVVDKRDDTVQNHSEIIKDVDANNGKREPADKYGSNFREFPSSGHEGTGSLAVVNAENASETVEVEKKAIDRKVTEACDNVGVGLLDNFVGWDNGLAPAEPDQRDSPSSDSTEVGPYMTSSSHRRKARKVRLLTDLLAAVDDPSNMLIRKDNAPFLAICDASREIRKQTVAEVEMENRENVKEVGVRKKRKWASEDFIKCSEGVPEIQEKENSPILPIIAKNSDTVLNSRPEDNGFTRILSQSSKKNNLPEHVDEVSNSIQKKKKKNKVNGNSSVMKSIGAEIKFTCSSSDGKEFTGREVGSALSSVPEIRKNTNTCFFKEKTNLPPMRPDQVLVIPRDLPSCLGLPPARMDFKVGENHPACDQFWSAKPSSAVNGAHLLSKTSSSASSEDVPMESNFTKDNNNSRSIHADPSFSSLHGSDAFRFNEVNGIVNDRIDCRIPFLCDRQRYASNMVDSRCFWTRNLEISGASKKKKAIKRQEHVTVVPQHRDKSSDPGHPDDIPMEIVELMAKYQYERRLQDAEMDNSRTGKNLWLEESSQKRKFPENVPNVVASKDFRSTAQKSFGIFSELGANSYKVNQLERYHTPPVHHTFYQDQGLPPKFQTIGGSGLANTPKNTMNEDYSSIKALDGNFLSLGVSGMWYPPKHNEAPVPRLSSMRPDCIPFVYSMMPQSCSLQSNGIDFHPRGPKTLPKVEMNCSRDPKIFASRANCLQKQEDFNFEAYRGETKNHYNSSPNRMEYERMVASIDVSSNETIPAMHLLSLMDAGMHSGKKIRLDEDARLAKQPSLPCEYHSKEVCGLHLGMCKAYIPLRRPSLDHDQAKILPCFSPSASSSRPTDLFRSGIDDGKPSVPVDVNDKRKGKCYEVGRPIGSSRVLSFLAHDGAGRETSYGFKPYHSTERNFPGLSEVRIISPYQRLPERETIEARNGIHMNQPLRSSPVAKICTLNRNPAEFNVPEEGNVYFLGREDLKLVKRPRNRPESSNARCCGGKKMAKAKRAAGSRQNQPQIARLVCSERKRLECHIAVKHGKNDNFSVTDVVV